MLRLTILSYAAAASMLLAQAPAGGPIPNYKTLKFPPLRDVELPKVETVTLPNGMKIFLLENHELPLVSGTALVRTGNLFDPKDKIGLAGITGGVIRSGGTKSRTPDQLNASLENLAASVESNIGETSGTLTFSALKENTDEVLAIFKDVLTQPAFAQEKVDLAKTQERSGISRRNDDALGIAQREFAALIYDRNSPYGWQQEYVHVDAIKREDLLAFYDRYYFPANVRLAVYGDFSIAEMKPKIEKLFADWTVKRDPVPPFPAVSAKAKPGIYLAEKEDVEQTFLRVGHLGGMLKDKDYPALDVMGSILGGGFPSRLVRKIRSEKGFAYSIGADWGANYNHPGTFFMGGSVKAETTVDTLAALQEEISKLRNLEVTDQELSTAKNTTLNSFVFNFASPSQTLSRMMTYDYHGYPMDYLQTYKKAVEGVTKADILRVAKEYVKPENFTVVAVGNPKKFGGKDLKSLGLPVEKIDLTIPQPKGAEKATASADTLNKGKQLLDKVQAAIGGADKIASIKDYQQSSSIVLVQGLTVKQTSSWMAPAALRQENVLPFGTIISFYDGAGGWVKTPQGKMPLAGPVLNQVKQQLLQDFFTLVRSNQTTGRTVNYAGEGKLDITEGANTVQLVVDEASGMPIKLLADATGPQGPVKIEMQYGDFKEVGGVKFPHRVTVLQGGQKFSENTISEMKVNTGVTLEALQKEQ